MLSGLAPLAVVASVTVWDEDNWTRLNNGAWDEEIECPLFIILTAVTSTRTGQGIQWQCRIYVARTDAQHLHIMFGHFSSQWIAKCLHCVLRCRIGRTMWQRKFSLNTADTYDTSLFTFQHRWQSRWNRLNQNLKLKREKWREEEVAGATFGQSHRTKIVHQHHFDVNVHGGRHHIGSHTHATIIDQNVDVAKNLFNFIHTVRHTIQIGQIQWQHDRWMSWNWLQIESNVNSRIPTPHLQ